MLLTIHTLAVASANRVALDLLVILATAGAVALVLGRLRFSTVPGYLIAGALIGPHAIGLVRAPEAISSLGELSIILLMFTVGVQLDMTRVRTGLLSIVAVAITATTAMALIAWPVALPFADSAPAALAIAMAMSIAATAVPLRTLETRRELHTTYGRLAFGITLFQDLLAIVMLALLPVLALWAGVGAAGQASGSSVELIRVGALSIAGLIGLLLVGRVVLPRLLSQAGRVGGEVLIVVSAAVALGSAIVSAYLGFSPELGAFLAGFLLASTPFRFQIAGQLIPMRDLFLAVFFTVVGMSVPVLVVMNGWWIVLLGLLCLYAVKIVAITAVSWAFGATPRFGLLAAVTLAPAGEFTLVMFAQARALGLLSEIHVGYASAIVGVSIIAAPFIVAWGHGFRFIDRVPVVPWIRSSALRRGADKAAADESPEETPPAFRAIVAGFGPVGRAVADQLQRDGVAITVIELNPRTVERQATLGRRVFYGDASNANVLESAGLGHVDAVVLTMPDDEVVLRACAVIRALRPDALIAVRASALSIGLRAMQLGADHSVVEEMVTAEAMSEQVLDLVRRKRAGEEIGPRLYAAPDVGAKA